MACYCVRLWLDSSLAVAKTRLYKYLVGRAEAGLTSKVGRADAGQGGARGAL